MGAARRTPHTPSADEVKARRRARRRSRVLLDLGVPFAQADPILNQTEDAVALGYDVLVGVVEEVKKGYADARKFVEERQQGKTPDVDWAALVERMTNVQEVFLGALAEGVEIASDTARSVTQSVAQVADTFKRSRSDVDESPRLAGPVFEDIITIDAIQGTTPDPVQRTKSHRGLTRLRIYAQASPLRMSADDGVSKAPDLTVKSVTFMPAAEGEEQRSVLKVQLNEVPPNQPEGTYEGSITATNFHLLVGRLRVRVLPSAQTTPSGSGSSSRTP